MERHSKPLGEVSLRDADARGLLVRACCIPGDSCNGVKGEVSLLSLEDMVRLAIDTIPAARDALALQLNSRFEGNVSGKRVKRDAHPLLSRLNLAEAILPHFGATDEERRDNLKRLQVEQIEGGPNHGMFVAKDVLAQLAGTETKNAAIPMEPNRNERHQLGCLVLPCT